MDSKNMIILILIILAVILLLNTQCGVINEPFDDVSNGDPSINYNNLPLRNRRNGYRPGEDMSQSDKLGRFDNTSGPDTNYNNLPIEPRRWQVPDPNYVDEDKKYEVEGDINNEANNIFYDQAKTRYANKDVRDLENMNHVNPERLAILRDNINRRRAAIANRWQDEMKYTQITPENTVPLGQNVDKGYTMLDPIQWFRAWERPPVCQTDKQCPVCPVAPEGTEEYMQFDSRDNISGPENINLSYVRNILNKERPRTYGGTGRYVDVFQPNDTRART